MYNMEKNMCKYLDCISVSNMRESDSYTIKNYVSGRTLMYRAALAVFKSAVWHGNIMIAVGGGNNGGDGYALAYILALHKYPCSIVKLSDKMTEDSSYFAEKAKSFNIPIFHYSKGIFINADIIVDCMLGTGFTGSLRKPWSDAVIEINSSKSEIISVDINSGMNGDTGEAEIAVHSDITVTIGFIKQGLVTEKAGKYIKKLIVADIGIILLKKEKTIIIDDNSCTEKKDDFIEAPSWLIPQSIDVSNEKIPK